MENEKNNTKIFQAGKFRIVINLSVKEVGPACSMLVYLNFINYLITIYRTVQFVIIILLMKLCQIISPAFGESFKSFIRSSLCDWIPKNQFTLKQWLKYHVCTRTLKILTWFFVSSLIYYCLRMYNWKIGIPIIYSTPGTNDKNRNA